MGTTAEKLQAILDSKAAIKTAISNKGGSITDSTPLDEYATAIGNIPAPILQSKTVNPTTSEQTITPDVGYNGLSQVKINAVTSSIDANIQASNIKKDVVILGVTGTFEGDTSALDKLIDGTITSVTSSVTNVKAYTFYYCTSLTSINLPNVTAIGTNAFRNCTSLTSADLPSLTTLDSSAFDACTSLTSVNIGTTTIIPNRCFYSTALANLTLSANSVVTLNSTNAFGNITGTITIYVPSDLISSYQTATNWSTLYNNSSVTFVAIS